MAQDSSAVVVQQHSCGEDDDEDDVMDRDLCKKNACAAKTPWFVMPVLASSIILGATSGPIMKSMEAAGAAPLAIAAWRHQISAATMLPFAVWQGRRMFQAKRSSSPTWSDAGTILLCSLALAGHFGLWIWSLANTSLTHSLFLCIMSPLFVTLFTFLRDGSLVRGEMVGVALGLLGSTILAAGAQVEKDIEFSVRGDLAALASAACFAFYLMCVKKLCGKLPVFVYLCPVNVVTTIFLSLALFISYRLNGSSNGYEDCNLFAWVESEFLLKTLLLGMGPGFLSHASYNILMGYVKPLTVSMGFSVSPVVGSFLGWLMNETAIPGVLTCFGGLVTMGATVWVSHASSQAKNQTIKEEDEAKRALLDADAPKETAEP